MKAGAFGVVRASSIDEVLSALAEHGDEARVIAGGQSLGPLMALRLAAPEVLVDLARVPGLDAVSVDGGVRLGAMVRQRSVERSVPVSAAVPLLSEAVSFIGHPAIRTQGTVCGSLAHADPAAELPAVALAAGATMHLRGARGERDVAAADFFTGYYSTAVGPTELLEAVTFPALAPRTGCAFVEFSRRHGDFALVGVAALVALAADGSIAAARLALSGVASTPLLAVTANALLTDATPDPSGRNGAVDAQVFERAVRPEAPASSPIGGSGRSDERDGQVEGSLLRPEAGRLGPTGSGRSDERDAQVEGSPLRPEASVPGEPASSGRRAGWDPLLGTAPVRPEAHGAGDVSELIRAAAEAVRAEVDPSGDLHATAAYRRHLAAVLTTRALTTAIARAQEATP